MARAADRNAAFCALPSEEVPLEEELRARRLAPAALDPPQAFVDVQGLGVADAVARREDDLGVRAQIAPSTIDASEAERERSRPPPPPPHWASRYLSILLASPLRKPKSFSSLSGLSSSKRSSS